MNAFDDEWTRYVVSVLQPLRNDWSDDEMRIFRTAFAAGGLAVKKLCGFENDEYPVIDTGFVNPDDELIWEERP